MKKLYALTVALMMAAVAVQGQVGFNPEVDTVFVPTTVVMPPSPLKMQIIFIGGHDTVQTTATYGNAAGKTLAKQWHDFIGFTPDNTGSGDLGWVSVNHEMVQANNNIGDGGGMTVFKIRRDANTDSLMIVPQTLTDGRAGKFFNVDFANTVGETGMNCGGITSTADGRIWTAEEWFQANNSAIYSSGAGVRDTSDFVIGTTTPNGFPGFNGQSLKKYQNLNYMVEIDPRQAKAIRKQYNWGRQEFEGGVVMPDNKTVYLGADATPGFFSKFVATTAGDFTVGNLYVYKHDNTGADKWVQIDNTVLSNMVNFRDQAVAAKATMFNRIEWVAYNPTDGNVYFTETGRDLPGSAWADEAALGLPYAPHHIARANVLGTTPGSSVYTDYYGRVMKYNVNAQSVTVHIEGGPTLVASPAPADYPAYHLSNPDGLNFFVVNKGKPAERTYMIIQEDLNGRDRGRMPAGIANVSCEMFLLDMTIVNPTINDLIRISAVPQGAEITGAVALPDGKTILVNSQHPSATLNPFPYNNSLTYAITGWDLFATSIEDAFGQPQGAFKVYPNPVSRMVFFENPTDVALFDAAGKRVMEAVNITSLDVQNVTPGVYYIRNAEGQTTKLVVE
ncbi:MAG: DUF839 domain-containing protein [Bacteroidia bacterium]|nr:DUF839 domain-containing protein [Bacteroidia bacterium]